MTTPDEIVERNGEPVTLIRVSDFAVDANGQVNPDSVEIELIDTKAIVSNPTEEDEQRLEGRLSTGSIRVTLPSDLDVSADRGGRRDRLFRPAVDGWGSGAWGGGVWGGADPATRVYEIVDVRSDRNPLSGTRKQTVIADERGGRAVESADILA